MEKEDKQKLLNISKMIILTVIFDFIILLLSYKFLELPSFNKYFYAYFIMMIITVNLNITILSYLARSNNNKKDKVRIVFDGLKLIMKQTLLIYAVIFLLAPIGARLLIGSNYQSFSLVIRLFSLSIFVLPPRMLYMALAKSKEKQYLYLFSEKLIHALLLFLLLLLDKLKDLGEAFNITLLTISALFAPLIIFTLIRSKPRKRRNKKDLSSEEEHIFEKSFENKQIIKYLNIYLVLDFLLMIIILKNLNYGQNFIDEHIFASGLLLAKLAALIITLIAYYIYPNLKSYLEYQQSGNIIGSRINIDQIIRKSLFITLPIVIVLAVFSSEVWQILFNKASLASASLGIFSFLIVGAAVYLASIIILIFSPKHKQVKRTLISSLIIKALLLYLFVDSFSRAGIFEHYVVLVTTTITLVISAIINFNYIAKYFHFNLEQTLRLIFDNLLTAMITTIIVVALRQLIKIENPWLVLIVFSAITTFSYLIISNVTGLKKTFTRRR